MLDSMLQGDGLGTMLMVAGLVGGAAVALWCLPWSEADLAEADADARAVAGHLTAGLRPQERRMAGAAAR
ncbi:MAG: hypothetical protein EXR72_15260 [Myxococcales bacterium]|nr:hypothetical protein [Myxococcales bacterium]